MAIPGAQNCKHSCHNLAGRPPSTPLLPGAVRRQGSQCHPQQGNAGGSSSPAADSAPKRPG
eukprot:899845-Lingulodinium_polyedra.AAC.1